VLAGLGGTSFCKGADFHPSRDVYVLYCLSDGFSVLDGTSNAVLSGPALSSGWANSLNFIDSTGIMVLNINAQL
jgi:hypothetical protein